jgi:hypothetical protein
MTKWRDTRRALILGGLSLGVTMGSIAAWVGQTRRDAEESKVAFCKVRAESSTKLSTFANSVGDFADGVTDIIQHGDPANPNVIRLGGLSLDLSVAARSYQPVTFDECMAATAAP